MSCTRFVILTVVLAATNKSILLAAPPLVSSKLAEQMASWFIAHPPREVVTSVMRLGDNDFAVREESQRFLESQGNRIQPYLNGLRKRATDFEARRRLDDIIRKVSWNDIAVARTLTLTVENITAPEALRIIADKAGYRLRIDPLGDEVERQKRYDFRFPSLTFWEAIDRVCDASGLLVQPEDDGMLRVSFQDGYNPVVAYEGPFRIVANQIYSGRYLQLGGLSRRTLPQRNVESLSINLGVMSEPKTPIVGIRGCVVSQLIDQSGKQIAQHQTGEERASQYHGGAAYRSYAQNVNLNIQRPATDSTSLKRVSGTVSLLVLAETKPDVVVPDVLQAKGKKFKGRGGQIDVTDVIATKGLAPQLVLTVTPATAGGQIDYAWINSIGQRLEATDLKQRPYTVQLNSTNFQSDGSAQISVMLITPDGSQPGPPFSLTLMEWVTKSMDVEFTFKDVPLP